MYFLEVYKKYDNIFVKYSEKFMLNAKTTVEQMGVLPMESHISDLPPVYNIETVPVMRLAILANRALAELKNKAARLPNQYVLMFNIAKREAKDSSEIENIVTTSDALYQSEITPENQLDPNTKEVRGYNAALWYGMELIKNKPLSTSVFEAIVRKIKSNDAGIRKTPGTVIKNENSGEIIHTPPQTEQAIREKLKNLEEFLYQDSGLDALIKMAVFHYQFEVIHPFYDGNGRTGRILNILWLVQEKLLDQPILFLSGYFLQHRNEYYERIAAVTQGQDWQGWIIYILTAVIETSKKTCELIDKIIKIREEYQKEIQMYFPKIYSFDLVESIFSAPYFRKSDFVNSMPTIGDQTLSKYLKLLSEPYQREDGTMGQILRMFKEGRENIYFNKKLFDILSGITN